MKIADDIMYSLFKDEEPNNAIDLLKFDHRNVSAMFVECLKEEDPGARKELIGKIVEELTLHSAAEEKLVYPILNVEDEGLSNEAYEEHHVMKMLLSEVALLSGGESNFKAKIKVLSEIVSHHVMEEEAHMLPKVQHSGFDMKELADKIKAEKEAMRAAGITTVTQEQGKSLADAQPTAALDKKQPSHRKPKEAMAKKATAKATTSRKADAKVKPIAKSTKTHKKAASAKSTPTKKQAVTKARKSPKTSSTTKRRSAA